MWLYIFTTYVDSYTMSNSVKPTKNTSEKATLIEFNRHILHISLGL